MTRSIDARVRKAGTSSTSLLIRAGDVVIQTEYAELAACEFLPGSNPPIPVEIPPSGVKSLVIGPFSGCGNEPPEGDYANTIRMPAYGTQDISTSRAFDDLQPSAHTSGTQNDVFAKVPVIAIGTGIAGQIDDLRQVRAHSVLPIWIDGSSVLVTLDWLDGELAEGSPNPEWHIRASTGLPLTLGIEKLREASQIITSAQRCVYTLHVSPWLLGARLLGDKGVELSHKTWQREWRFNTVEEFTTALRRLTAGLTGSDPSGLPAAA